MKHDWVWICIGLGILPYECLPHPWGILLRISSIYILLLILIAKTCDFE